MAREWLDLAPEALTAALRQPGNELAVLTTYNVHFPFLEGVVLRHLWGAGVRLIVVLADADRVAEASSDAMTRPRLAGRRYALLPIRAPRSFHPKLVLLAGKRGQQVLVGSHNLTFSGFVYNREITHRLAGAPDVLAAWAFVRSWAARSTLPPKEVANVLAQAENLAPVLRTAVSAGAEPLFIGSFPEGPSLWSWVRSRLPTSVEQLLVLGPYLDNELALIRKLQAALHPRSTVVAVDPVIGSAPSAATGELPNTRFVNARSLTLDAKGPVHAKLVWMRDADGTEWLVSGSANPTAAAFLAGETARNAEAVVVRRSDSGTSFYDGLGLKELDADPELTDIEWSELSNRVLPLSAGGSACMVPLLMAVVGPHGIVVQDPRLATSAVAVARVFGQADTGPRQTYDLLQDGERCVVRSPLDDVTLVELYLANGDGMIRVLVHHPGELAARSRTGLQQAFHEALRSLDTAVPDIDGLLRIVEKVVFDEDPPPGQPPPHSRRDGRTHKDKENVPTDTGLPPAERDGSTASDGSSSLAGGDLALVLDVLIARLGHGIQHPIVVEDDEEDGEGAAAVSEEELIGQDDDRLVTPQVSQPLAIEVGALCQRKLATLGRRLRKQLDLARMETDSARRRVVTARSAARIAAVLAVALRLKALEVRPPSGCESQVCVGEALQCDLLHVVLRGFFYGPDPLASAAAQGACDGREEFTACLGLTGWLLMASGRDRHTPVDHANREAVARSCQELAELVLLFGLLAADPQAAAVAEEAIRSTATAGDVAQALARWTDHLGWAGRLKLVETSPGSVPVESDVPAPGDLVFQPAAPVRRVRVVTRGRPDDLVLCAPEKGGEGGIITYKRRSLETLGRPFVVIRRDL